MAFRFCALALLLALTASSALQPVLSAGIALQGRSSRKLLQSLIDNSGTGGKGGDGGDWNIADSWGGDSANAGNGGNGGDGDGGGNVVFDPNVDPKVEVDPAVRRRLLCESLIDNSGTGGNGGNGGNRNTAGGSGGNANAGNGGNGGDGNGGGNVVLDPNVDPIVTIDPTVGRRRLLELCGSLIDNSGTGGNGGNGGNGNTAETGGNGGNANAGNGGNGGTGNGGGNVEIEPWVDPTVTVDPTVDIPGLGVKLPAAGVTTTGRH